MAATALSIVSNAKAVRTGVVRSFGALRGGEERSRGSETGRVGKRGEYVGGIVIVDWERTATGAMIAESQKLRPGQSEEEEICIMTTITRDQDRTWLT